MEHEEYFASREEIHPTDSASICVGAIVNGKDQKPYLVTAVWREGGRPKLVRVVRLAPDELRTAIRHNLERVMDFIKLRD